jgi:PEP-CTERM motif
MKRATLILAALALLSGWPWRAEAGNLVVNGGFETGDFTGWTQTGSTDYVGVYPYVPYPSGITPIIYPHTGNYFASFSGYASEGLGGITQTITTTPGQTYVLSYWFDNNNLSSNEFKVTWDGTTLSDLVNIGQLNWSNYTFVVTGTGSDTVAFAGYQNDGWNGLDDVSLTLSSVPEPSSLILSGMALVGMTIYMGRRRKPSRA